MKRTLSLKREALAELATDDLARVAGAARDTSLSCPVKYCLNETYSIKCPGYTWGCPSTDAC